MNYTKGNWILYGYGVNDEQGEIIVSAHLRFKSKRHTVEDVNDEETEANAKLISASPLLYEALKSMLNIFDRGFVTEGSVGRTTCDEAIKAIAKAEGR
jgi:hypothetical protein